MEKWKIAAILGLLALPIGAGWLQQKREAPIETTLANNPAGVNPTPVPSPFLGRTIGADLPNWQITDWMNTSRPIAMPSLKGKPALVEVFRLSCSHCQAAAPFMQALYERYAPRGLQMVAVQAPSRSSDPANPEANWKSVQDWVKERKLTYPVGFDADSKWFLDKMNGQSYPTTMVMDESGKVISAHTGFNPEDPKSVEKTVAMVVEIERLLPGSKPLAARSQDLAKWLAPLIRAEGNADLQKAFAADLEERLKA